MERLLELAAKSSGAAAVYATDSVSDRVQFDNGRFKGIESSMQSGVSLLLLKDGRLGSAYTRNLLDRESLVGNALAALRRGGSRVRTAADPGPAAVEHVRREHRASAEQRVGRGMRPGLRLVGRAHRHADKRHRRPRTANVRLLNTSGTDLKTRSSAYFLLVSALYPGSYAAISRVLSAKSFDPMPDGTSSSSPGCSTPPSARRSRWAGG